MGLEDIVEFAENPEPRCPVLLLLDTSGSMSGERIQELNQGISVFRDIVSQDAMAKKRAEIAIVSFGGNVELRQDFVTVENFHPFALATRGDTPMGEGIDYALQLIEQRKQAYRANGIPFYRPWLFLITDGAPTDNWQNAAQNLHQAENNKKLTFFAVAVAGADMSILRQIASAGRPPVTLNGLDFTSMFLWLSASMTQVSTGKVGDMQPLPPIDSWASVST